ncbi:MAG: hypothetical protein JF616_17600 [Fibrobacteres bacterium]|nr:hypothetical protein [Fibrobacterota bacterium]
MKSAISVCAFCLGCIGFTAAADALPSSTHVEKADSWSALFKRGEGWTGADGIFSIPLSGYEGPGHASGGKTLFVFSDTFIGHVDSSTGARKNAVLINNSLAVLDGDQPDPARIRFLWGSTDKAAPTAAFVPDLPSTAGRQAWYWLQDGFARNGYVYDLPIIMARDTTGAPGFQFKVTGVALLKIPLDSNGDPDMAHAVQRETPLFHGGAKPFYFGCGIFVNTRSAGAPDPDDSVYVYGRDGLYVARVQADEFEDFGKWRYWDGQGWNEDIAKSASLGLGGPELSVIAIDAGALRGKYLLTTMGLENKLFVRIGDSPAGPFGDRHDVYVAPEWSPSDSIVTYNAKAHPSLSRDGNWLVTYNVNTTSWARDLADADIYRPRFLWMRFDPADALLGTPEARARSRAGAEWNGSGSIGFGRASGAVRGTDGRLWPPAQGLPAGR